MSLYAAMVGMADSTASYPLVLVGDALPAYVRFVIPPPQAEPWWGPWWIPATLLAALAFTIWQRKSQVGLTDDFPIHEDWIIQ